MDELDDLSRRITTCWASLGRKLGVNEDVIDGITVNNFQYPSPEEKALKMLKGWRKKGKASSIVELAAALRKVGKGGLAEQFEWYGRSKRQMMQMIFILLIFDVSISKDLYVNHLMRL